jgi:hypothetical protein
MVCAAAAESVVCLTGGVSGRQGGSLEVEAKCWRWSPVCGQSRDWLVDKACFKRYVEVLHVVAP